MKGNLTDLIGFLSIFKQIQNYEKILDWLRIELGKEIDLDLKKKFFLGYHYFITITWKALVNELSSSSIFNLKCYLWAVV